MRCSALAAFRSRRSSPAMIFRFPAISILRFSALRVVEMRDVRTVTISRQTESSASASDTSGKM